MPEPDAMDFEYLKLTVALVMLLIIVFLITSRFRTHAVKKSDTTGSGFAAGASANSVESFAPIQ